ncbi:MAG: hypothetical protein JRJ84_12315, partial [Deltaproteobacteria bacterium]|nr:hypothetical protein [Deltaproteobacteria bacterium]
MIQKLGSLLATLFTACLVGLAVGVLVQGWSYYLLEPTLRSEHALHAMLRPGGSVGVGLGVLGTVLMVAMLSYSVRKAFARVRLLGTLPAWLRFHMICGVMGPVLIVIHGGLFLPSGLVAVGFWCMILVALSGLFGRYVYGFFPSTAAGRVDDLDAARASLADLRARLVQETHDVHGEQIGEAIR